MDIEATMPDFPELIHDGKLYIDKTEYIWKLVNDMKYNFICRPRRFGKTLLLSTLKAFFMGKKELFSGLAIEKKEYDWKEYPVIHFDFSKVKSDSVESMEFSLASLIREHAQQYGIELCKGDAHLQFYDLLEKLGKKSQVVILIDEYDHPVLEHIGKADYREYISYYRNFYSLLKAESSRIHFVLICGVSNIALTTFYSAFNNPRDLTRDPAYATLFGYTQSELEHYFGEHIAKAAEVWHVTEDELKQKVKAWYDGYCFEERSENVYNPVSIGKFFSGGYKLCNFWISTGTPQFLLDCMKEKPYKIERALSSTYGDDLFSPIDPLMELPVTKLLFQTGYLTLDSSHIFPLSMPPSYKLRFPNQEVASTFHFLEVSLRTGIPSFEVSTLSQNVQTALYTGNTDALREAFEVFFGGIEYSVFKGGDRESNYQAALGGFLRALNDSVKMEYVMGNGSIDMVIRSGDFLYLFEFKINKNARIALSQIRRKKYYQPFLLEPCKIILIGVNFNPETRQIDAWKASPLLTVPES